GSTLRVDAPFVLPDSLAKGRQVDSLQGLPGDHLIEAVSNQQLVADEVDIHFDTVEPVLERIEQGAFVQIVVVGVCPLQQRGLGGRVRRQDPVAYQQQRAAEYLPRGAPSRGTNPGGPVPRRISLYHSSPHDEFSIDRGSDI